MADPRITGGKLYNEGGYGCIFMPPLKCKGETKEQKGNMYIDKLTSIDDATQEMNVAQRIHGIPLWKNYFIVPSSMCEPAPLDKQTNTQIGKCGILSKKQLDNFRLLRMEFGGKPLRQVRFDTKQQSLFSFVQHIIEAGALLNLFGIVHGDIHQGNILVDTDFVPRLIDFNLSVEIRNPDLYVYLHHPVVYKLFQEPPDNVLVNAVYRDRDPITTINTLIQERTTLRKITALLGVSLKEMKDDLEEFYATSKSVQTGNIQDWFNSYWSKIDTWAIGMNIVLLLTDNLLWSSFPSGDYAQYKDKLLPILKDMVHVNPAKRIDCVQALARLDANNFIVRKYGREWLSKIKPSYVGGSECSASLLV